MGFHKRHINIELIKEYLNRGELSMLFSSDAFFFNDDISYSVYIMYSENSTEEEIKLKIGSYDKYN